MKIVLYKHTIQVVEYLPKDEKKYTYYQTDWKSEHGKLPDARFMIIKTEEKIVKL